MQKSMKRLRLHSASPRLRGAPGCSLPLRSAIPAGAALLVGSAVLLQGAPAWAKPWKGAELITQQTFRYGAFEARIRAARGSGLITPFFLWKNNSEVPGQQWQEQDFEIFGSDGRYQTQLMTPGEEEGQQRTEHNIFHTLPQLAWERYYTYRMEWTPEHLSFYVDGQLVRSESDPEEFDKLLNPDRAEAAQLRVSIWAGDGAWSGVFDEDAAPAAAFVNWVQTYAHTPGAGPDGSDFTPLWRDDFNGSGSPDSSRWWSANWTFDAAVNDYVPQNAGVKDGTLVLVFTDESSTGVLPDVPADDGSSSSAASDDEGASAVDAGAGDRGGADSGRGDGGSAEP
jgi:endo-1,3-1,4-beta-glycanase ExoK